ncbi:RICIN domain-containing protein [Streptomyces sp. NPDC048279]|uniref:RICIN domain-containing protein n=1 Tax=Streptomyces sp. NPDC048279 TaxID=3154714 RepID=UPI003420BC8A
MSVATAGNGPDADEPEEQSRPGRPRKPLLAAAALTGVVLLAMPLLLVGGDDKDKRPAGSEAQEKTLLTDKGVPADLQMFVPETATPQDGSTSPSPSASAKAKLAKDGDAAGPAVLQAGGGGADSSKDNQPSPTKSAVKLTPRLAYAQFTPYWESTTRRVTNQLTGLCLIRLRGERFVAQGSCGNEVWRRYVIGNGEYLIKNVPNNTCLDTDGKNMYLSGCTARDSGQHWKLPSAGSCTTYVVSVPNGTYLTGWNDRTASLAAQSAADKAGKLRWTFSPSLTGC